MFLTPIFPCYFQRMPSGTVVIFIEFPVMHWHFDPMLNAFVMVAQVAIKVYMFHSCQFCAPFMSLIFHPHEPFDDVTLDDICPPFHPLRYLTDGESDSDTCLASTYFVESDSSELTYSTSFVEPNPSEPSYPSVIRLSLGSSTSSTTGQAPTPVRRCGFICTRVVPCGHRLAWGAHRGQVP